MKIVFKRLDAGSCVQLDKWEADLIQCIIPGEWEGEGKGGAGPREEKPQEGKGSRSHPPPAGAVSGTTSRFFDPRFLVCPRSPALQWFGNFHSILAEDKRHHGRDPWIKVVIYRCRFWGTFFLLIHEPLFYIRKAVHKSFSASRN